MSSLLNVYRQSSQPVEQGDQLKYQDEWGPLFDLIQERAAKAVNKRPLRKLTAAVVSTRMCAVMEHKLFIKYSKDVKVRVPTTQQGWKRLMKRFGAPLLLAEKDDIGRKVILIIMDKLGT